MTARPIPTAHIHAALEPRPATANHEGMRLLFASMDRLAADHADYVKRLECAVERIRCEGREG